MSGNKQQQTHTKQLKAGVPMNIDQPCEFIFIDQGADLDFVIGDSRLSGRKAGDFARFDVPVQSVQVKSPYDQTIKIVLGFGEFSRLIVSGELNVSSYVSSLRGVSDSLPMELTRRVIFDSDTEETLTAASPVYTSSITEAQYGACGSFYFGGKFYSLIQRGASDFAVVEYDKDNADGVYTVNALANSAEWAGITGSAAIANATVTPDGEVYVILRRTSSHHSVYKFRVGQWALILVDDDYTGAVSGAGKPGGGVYKDGALYLVDSYFSGDSSSGANSQCSLCVFDVKAGAFVSRTRIQDDNFSGQSGYSLLDIDGTVYVCRLSNGNGNLYAFDMDTATVGAQWGFDPLPDNGTGNPAITPDGLYVAVPYNGSDVQVREARDLTIYGRVTIQQGADVASAVSVILYEPIIFYINNAGDTIISGQVAEYILRSFEGVPIDNYRDYVVSMEADNGSVTMKVNSGTQTWAYRKILDAMKVKSGTDVTLGIMPEFFDQ